MTEELLVDNDTYLKAGIHIGTKFKTRFMENFIYKTRPDGLFPVLPGHPREISWGTMPSSTVPHTSASTSQGPAWCMWTIEAERGSLPKWAPTG